MFWTILIFYFSLKPQSTSSSSFLNIDGMDKVVHGICYMILAITWLFSLSPAKENKKLFYIILLSFTTIGVLIEYLQESMGLGRECDVYDMIANAIGVVLGVVVYRKYFCQ